MDAVQHKQIQLAFTDCCEDIFMKNMSMNPSRKKTIRSLCRHEVGGGSFQTLSGEQILLRWEVPGSTDLKRPTKTRRSEQAGADRQGKLKSGMMMLNKQQPTE